MNHHGYIFGHTVEGVLSGTFSTSSYDWGLVTPNIGPRFCSVDELWESTINKN